MKKINLLLLFFMFLASFSIKAENKIDFRFSSGNVVEALVREDITHIKLDIETTERLYELTENNYGKQVHIYIDDQLEDVFTIVVGIDSGVLRITRPSKTLNNKLRPLSHSVE